MTLTTPPFDISVHDPKPTLRELHFSFTPIFQNMSVDQRLETLRSYIESLIKQTENLQDENAQRGIITVLQITEQLIPHIQSNSLPLHETLIVELGEDAEGSSLDDLLG
jgi:hypothetical protein